jgi:hypothetical protein
MTLDPGPYFYQMRTKTQQGNLCLLGSVVAAREKPMMDMLPPEDPISPSELVVVVTDGVYG